MFYTHTHTHTHTHTASTYSYTPLTLCLLNDVKKTAEHTGVRGWVLGLLVYFPFMCIRIMYTYQCMLKPCSFLPNIQSNQALSFLTSHQGQTHKEKIKWIPSFECVCAALNEKKLSKHQIILHRKKKKKKKNSLQECTHLTHNNRNTCLLLMKQYILLHTF